MPPSLPSDVVTVASPWWARAFSAEYAAIYEHRGDEEARAQLPFVIRALALRPFARVLDLACGEGRYARALSSAGYRVTGYDFSAELLELAAHRSPALPGVPTYVRGDMRTLPFFEQFDAVVMLFTSFGYFEEPSDDAKVLENVERALVPGGRFLIDLAGAARLRATLVAEDERTQGWRTIRSTRRLDDETPGGPYVRKHVVVTDARTGTVLHDVEERVRLYTAEQLDAALVAAGLEPVGTPFGDFDGSPHGAESPRLIRVAQRPKTTRRS